MRNCSIIKIVFVILFMCGCTSNKEKIQRNESVQRPTGWNEYALAYSSLGMEDVDVHNITYTTFEDSQLTMDVFYPLETEDGDRLPAVIFVLGFRMSSLHLRDNKWYASWGRLVAANGIVGINYDTEQPDKDLEALIHFLKDNAKELKIHSKKIGILSCSGNVPTAMSYLFQKRRTDIRFGIFYYGISFTPDNKYRDEFNKMLGSLGGYSEELEDVTYIQPGFPILLVKAGKDVFPNINESIDHFRDFAESSETKVTFIEYEDGVHGFDAYQHTEESAEIIVKTLEFMKTNFEK